MIEREVLDEEAGIHHRFLEHATGISRSRGISFKVYVIGYVCNIKYVSHIDVFQVHLYGIRRIVGKPPVDTHITVMVTEIEIIHIHLARVYHYLRRMYLPKCIIQDNVCLFHIHHRFQQRLFACCTQELCNSRQLSAISRYGIISPI